MVFSIFSLQQEANLENPIFAANLDELFCEEEEAEALGEGCAFGFVDEKKTQKCEEDLKMSPTLLESDLYWEEEELVRLLCKEKDELLSCSAFNSDGYLMVARKEAIEWMVKVVEHYGFTALTGVLAVNYYDRFMSSLYFQKDKPWMSQLAAVACLSIAAKMDEIQVPLLLHLQVENSKMAFEAKTIMRMELVVLSTLKWKTSLVTPISFLDHIVRRFGLMINLHWGFLHRCECILLSIIADSRLKHYLPSVIAAATMLFVINDIDPCNATDYRNQLFNLLNISKEKLDECSRLINELMDENGWEGYKTRKRKRQSLPASPSGVVDAYFSCESSNESWNVAPSVSSSPKSLFKRSRAQDQPMRLAPLSSVSVGVGRNFH